MKSSIRKSLFFTLALLPVALVGGIFTGLYSYESYSEALQAELLLQFGSVSVFLAVIVLQSVCYAVFCGMFGRLLAEKTGLWKPFRLQKKPILFSISYAVFCGVVLIFVLDYAIFGKFIPQVAESYRQGVTLNNLLSSVLYGGILEEVMLRLFLMSLLSFLLWKIFYRNREQIPTGVYVAANCISAILFAAGHLPATAVLLGITPLILVRCFLLNGAMGMLFGRLYRSYGIGYAMIGHIGYHLVSKLFCLLIV